MVLTDELTPPPFEIPAPSTVTKKDEVLMTVQTVTDRSCALPTVGALIVIDVPDDQEVTEKLGMYVRPLPDAPPELATDTVKELALAV